MKKVVCLLLAAVLLAVPAWAMDCRPNPEGNPGGHDVLLWHFDEPTGGPWRDSSGNGRHGASSKSSGITAMGIFTDAESGGQGAVTGLGENPGLYLPGTYSTQKGEELTVEAWIYWPADVAIDGYQCIAQRRTSGTTFWRLGVGTLGPNEKVGELNFLVASYNSGTGTVPEFVVSTEGANFQNDVWYHVAVTVKHHDTDNNEIKIYVTPVPPDAGEMVPVLKGSATGLRDLQASTAIFHVGTEIGGGTRKFRGRIDEVRICNKALEPEEFYSVGASQSISPRNVKLAWGATKQFEYKNAKKPVVWSIVSGADVGQIDPATGLFTTLQMGTCLIRAVDNDGVWDQVLVTVTEPSISPDTASMLMGHKQQFTFSPATPITWQVIDESNPGVGTIDNNGLFTGRLPGTCKIRATDSLGNTDDSGTITVNDFNRPRAIFYSDAVTVDGDLSEWADAEWTPLDQIYEGYAPADLGPTDAVYAVRWGDNGNKLYVAVKVLDSVCGFSTGYVGWNVHDAVELYIHTTGTDPIPYNEDKVGGFLAYDSAQQYTIGFPRPFDVEDPFDLWEVMGDGNVIDIPDGAFTAAGHYVFAPEGSSDKHQYYYEAAITPYHSLRNGQISPLSAGQVIGFDVVVATHDGTTFGMMAENTEIHKFRDYNQFGKHVLLGQPTSMSIGEAKTAPFGSTVGVSGIVSAVFADCFYIESPERTYGIRVNKANSGRTPGEAVTVYGTVEVLPSGERFINGLSISLSGSGEIKPLAMNNLTLGGGNFGNPPDGQAGVASGAGLNNIGLLVKTTGKVTSKGNGWFGIDDGSGVGIKVYGNLDQPDIFTPYVAVTGICSCEKDNYGAIQRVILATDIDVVEGGWVPIYEGIDYATATKTSPRLMRAFAVRVDLQNPYVSLFATPDNGGDPLETTRQTTLEFLSAYNLEAAMNANWFSMADPDYANVDGVLVSNGNVVSGWDRVQGSLRFTADKTPSFHYGDVSWDPSGFHTVVTGSWLCLSNGSTISDGTSNADPRSSVGISQDNRYLYMVVVDGRQPGYSEGCTFQEMGQWQKDLGAYNAIHMDGGASSTICTASGGVLNSPSDGVLRKVGASLGINSIPLATN